MLNNVVLVGRLVDDPTIKDFDGDFKGAFLTLAINRPFKNYENKTETDFIRVCIWEGLAENACSYCHKGDVIGIRGRLSMRKTEYRVAGSDEVKMISTIDVIGEKIVFISSSKKKNKENTDYDE